MKNFICYFCIITEFCLRVFGRSFQVYSFGAPVFL
jgi:hypothetical protein